MYQTDEKQPLLAGICPKIELTAVGILSGSATMENGTEISQKDKNRASILPSNSNLGLHPQDKKKEQS